MSVVAKSLDILQGDLAVSVGYLLPTIYQLQKAFEDFGKKELKFCIPLVQSLQNGLMERFYTSFNDNTLIKAACFHPRFYYTLNYM